MLYVRFGFRLGFDSGVGFDCVGGSDSGRGCDSGSGSAANLLWHLHPTACQSLLGTARPFPRDPRKESSPASVRLIPPNQQENSSSLGCAWSRVGPVPTQPPPIAGRFLPYRR